VSAGGFAGRFPGRGDNHARGRGASSSSAPSFAATRNYRVGRNPAAVAIGDLNGDRKPDLAVVNSEGPSVSVLMNRGDGSFRAARNSATGSEHDKPSAVAIGNLTGDRKPDVAIAGFYKGLGDLTGDHKPELVTTNSNANTVSLLVNKGNGTFEPKRDFRAGRNPTAVAIGDLNADGKPDVAAVNNWSNTISVLANRGGGSFAPKRDFPTARGPDAVTIADLNGDRRPDLANLDLGRNSISILVNRRDGSFERRLNYAAGGEPASLAQGDLNGDGKVDLATTHSESHGSVGVLLARPGLCTVQDVRVVTVEEAKRMLARANCRLGTIRRAYSNRVERGLISAQKPKPGTVLPKLGEVDVRVSRGPRS
jgi:hypothetical protein